MFLLFPVFVVCRLFTVFSLLLYCFFSLSLLLLFSLSIPPSLPLHSLSPPLFISLPTTSLSLSTRLSSSSLSPFPPVLSLSPPSPSPSTPLSLPLHSSLLLRQVQFSPHHLVSPSGSDHVLKIYMCWPLRSHGWRLRVPRVCHAIRCSQEW